MLLPFLCPQPRYHYLVFYHSPGILFLKCLSLNIQSKTILGKEPCGLCGEWTNRSCGKNTLLAHLVKMQICVQLLFWVLIEEHRYPKLSRVFGLSSLWGKRAAFPCLALSLWPSMLQVSCWTDQFLSPCAVPQHRLCLVPLTHNYPVVSLHRRTNASGSQGIPLSHACPPICSTLEKICFKCYRV